MPNPQTHPRDRLSRHFVKRLINNVIRFNFVLFLLMMLISVPLRNMQTNAIPSSNSLDVTYHAQEIDSYCAPACVSMVIQYISADKVSTDILAREMKTNINGTDPYMIHLPFDNRGFTLVGETHATLDELKEQNSRGYASITSVWFDTNHKLGHYVVVVGYNMTGILVNDPWPTDWIQPEGRTTGRNVFIPNSLFADLWKVTYQWVLEVPYPAHSQSLPAISPMNQLLTATLFLGLVVSIVLIARRRKPHRLSSF